MVIDGGVLGVGGVLSGELPVIAGIAMITARLVKHKLLTTLILMLLRFMVLAIALWGR